ncbi:Uncharacterised protein [Chlamydia trachomatis]|nr:Uncharacterised protein [Chlamydia trachomatis]CRH88824.1 Uncharacterised protein [Chlamydia trachomatis]CRI74302.1 Uncharacterised protein [Chlamydia trachomatis]
MLGPLPLLNLVLEQLQSPTQETLALAQTRIPQKQFQSQLKAVGFILIRIFRLLTSQELSKLQITKRQMLEVVLT